ncbi:MAG: Fe-S cluster assembly protein HesB, partial [Actinobacteria bacterium]|nr:Fe-S cluster assembly protein HesB [Actinomycetota bacterium]
MLNLTPNDEANQILTNDPFALLVGMLLDQQFPMERAFAGPQLLAQRLGTPDRLDPHTIASTSAEELLAAAKGPPAIHRYPSSMIERIRSLAQIVIDQYDGDASRIWTTAKNGNSAVKAVQELPGFGEQKAKIFIALVGKQLN